MTIKLTAMAYLLLIYGSQFRKVIYRNIKAMDNTLRDNNTLTSISMRMNPSYELYGRMEDLNRKTSISVQRSTRLIVMLMILLLLITLVSVAVSVATYRHLRSEHLQTEQFCTSQSIVLQSCGTGIWSRVAYLNMSDPSQQCPSAWREYNSNGVRACGRPATSRGSCPTTTYSTGHQYSRICGRVIGYQIGTPDAFDTDNDTEFDGISITYGAQRNHVWSYVAGLYDTRNSLSNCPCSSEQAKMAPQLIGDNYYCESGNPSNIRSTSQFFSTDPLWDGQQCEGTCCAGTNSPPWFSVQLPAPTNNAIEVSICLDQRTDDEDTPVELIEIYVQ